MGNLPNNKDSSKYFMKPYYRNNQIPLLVVNSTILIESCKINFFEHALAKTVKRAKYKRLQSQDLIRAIQINFTIFSLNNNNYYYFVSGRFCISPSMYTEGQKFYCFFVDIYNLSTTRQKQYRKQTPHQNLNKRSPFYTNRSHSIYSLPPFQILFRCCFFFSAIHFLLCLMLSIKHNLNRSIASGLYTLVPL